jgi:hypothetical protein
MIGFSVNNYLAEETKMVYYGKMKIDVGLGCIGILALCQYE